MAGYTRSIILCNITCTFMIAQLTAQCRMGVFAILHSITCTGWTVENFESPTCAGNTVQSILTVCAFYTCTVIQHSAQSTINNSSAFSYGRLKKCDNIFNKYLHSSICSVRSDCTVFKENGLSFIPFSLKTAQTNLSNLWSTQFAQSRLCRPYCTV